ncbi:MAG: hypothetical protein LBL85_07260 [Methanocalculaceae archaeon]|jgi:hypothetical protein|nr:hypothetical protein [Methanocalculaceae archaeon]
METKEVKHVDVWSAAKLCAAISLVLTLIAGIIFGIVAALGIAVYTHRRPPQWLREGFSVLFSELSWLPLWV